MQIRIMKTCVFDAINDRKFCNPLMHDLSLTEYNGYNVMTLQYCRMEYALKSNM